MRYVFIWMFVFLCLAKGEAIPRLSTCELKFLANSPFEYESAITLVQLTSASKRDFIERLCSRYEMFAQEILDERTHPKDRDVAKFFLKTYGKRLRLIFKFNEDEKIIESVLNAYQHLER